MHHCSFTTYDCGTYTHIKHLGSGIHGRLHLQKHRVQRVGRSVERVECGHTPLRRRGCIDCVVSCVVPVQPVLVEPCLHHGVQRSGRIHHGTERKPARIHNQMLKCDPAHACHNHTIQDVAVLLSATQPPSNECTYMHSRAR